MKGQLICGTVCFAALAACNPELVIGDGDVGSRNIDSRDTRTGSSAAGAGAIAGNGPIAAAGTAGAAGSDSDPPGVEFHLVEGIEPNHDLTYLDFDPDAVSLVDAPIIADADIVAYDVSRHAFTLDYPFAEVEAKLETVPVTGVPFVLQVDGVAVLGGWFWTPLSSIACSSCVIIETGIRPEGLSEYEFRLDYGNPSASDDLREDSRLLARLKADDKLVESAHPERIDVTEATALVTEWARTDSPDLGSDVEFDVAELEVAALWEELHAQLFFAGFVSSDGRRFREQAFVYFDGALFPFAETFGGFGLMSGTVEGGALYYSYSFGSGVTRSVLGRLTIQEGRPHFSETGGFSDLDLFLESEGEGVQIEAGQLVGFNDWSDGAPWGTLVVRDGALTVLDSSGNEITPDIGGS